MYKHICMVYIIIKIVHVTVTGCPAVTCAFQTYMYMCSNIPSKPAYGVYISQLVRIGRICSTYLQFKNKHYDLTAKLVKQGFWYSRLCRAFRRFSRMHATIFSKFGCSVRKHIQEGICLPALDVALGRHITTRN